MAIPQHSEAMGEPTHLSFCRPTVTIRRTDALAERQDQLPGPHPDPSLPEGSLNCYEEADEETLTRWRQEIGTYLVHEMRLYPQAQPGEQFVLSEFPKNYKLYIHYKGDRNNPRKDYYLCGSRFGMKFRTPAEFVLHAKWLAFDAPRDGDTRLCACRYCSQNKQTVITKYLKDKRGSAASEPSHSRSVASRPTKRRRAGEPEKEILYKDYTLLFDAKRLEDDKHHLHQIKDEEL